MGWDYSKAMMEREELLRDLEELPEPELPEDEEEPDTDEETLD